jgi:hypothetical protein
MLVNPGELEQHFGHQVKVSLISALRQKTTSAIAFLSRAASWCGFMVMMIECESVIRGRAFRSDRSGIDRHKTPRTNMRQWERDGSCFDHLSPCL